MSEFTLANKVGLDNIAARAWTDRDSEYVGVNIQICFRSTYVENKKQKSNCLRLLSSMKGVKQYEHIIFETKNTQFNFKTNKRYGTNITFWLKERANEDTISLNLFLNQLNKTENAIVGGMCKKIAETKWLTATVGSALDKSNKVDPTIVNRFKPVGYKDISRIAKRCQATVEQRIGNIELVKVAASKTTQKLEKCEYSKNKLLDLQSTLKYLDIYKSKIDGQFGPGTKKAIKIAKNRIFHFANRSSDCLSANELSWLKLLSSVKRQGQNCNKFNTKEELREIATLLERIGRPVFGDSSALNKVRYSNRDYKRVVYAIIDYENSLDDDYFKVAQRDRDCRLISLEKIGLAAKVENNFSNGKNNQSAKKSANKKAKDNAKEKNVEEELAKKKAKEELTKKREEEKLAKKEAEEEKRKAENSTKLAEEQKKKNELINKYRNEAKALFEDIRKYYASGKNLGIEFAIFFNEAKDIEFSDDIGETLIQNYESLKKYVQSYEDFLKFRVDLTKEKQKKIRKEIEELTKKALFVISNMEKWVSENPFSETSPKVLLFLKSFQETFQSDDIDLLKDQLDLLVKKAEEYDIKLPGLLDNMTRDDTEKAKSDGTKKAYSKKEITTIINEARFFVKDLEAFVNVGNKFDLDFVYKFASINKFLSKESWTNDEVEEFSNFSDWCLSNKEFKVFHLKKKAEDIENVNREIIQINKDKEKIIANITEWVTNNAMEDKAPVLLDSLKLLQSCKAPDTLSSRIENNKVKNFSECIKSNLGDIDSLSIIDLDYCSNLSSEKLCKPQSLSSAKENNKNILADTPKNYCDNNNKSLFRCETGKNKKISLCLDTNKTLYYKFGENFSSPELGLIRKRDSFFVETGFFRGYQTNYLSFDNQGYDFEFEISGLSGTELAELRISKNGEQIRKLSCQKGTIEIGFDEKQQSNNFLKFFEDDTQCGYNIPCEGAVKENEITEKMSDKNTSNAADNEQGYSKSKTNFNCQPPSARLAPTGKVLNLAFCTGFTSFFLEYGGATKKSTIMFSDNPSKSVWKRIDSSCNYKYPEGASFETEYKLGSLGLSLAIIEYKSNPTPKLKKKIQEPIFAKSCTALIRSHIKDFNAFAE